MICLYYKFGYCKYNDKCKKEHVEELCENDSCLIFNCDKRHPKCCNFQREFGRCKYLTYCKYDQRKPRHIREMNKSLEEMRKTIDNYEKKTKDPISNTIAKDNEKKIDTFESQMQSLRKVIEEKDANIIQIEKNTTKMENKFKDLKMDELKKK